jgi:murein DD-endopeptidase MepM/ murein hydrolase activator NlpD
MSEGEARAVSRSRRRWPRSCGEAVALIALALAVLLILAPVTAAEDAVVQKASVSPGSGYTDSADGVKIEFRITGSAPADVTITISGSGGVVRTIAVPGVVPGADETVKWDGLTDGGRPVADGNYKVTVTVGADAQDAGSVELHRDFFPVRGPHGTRGPIGNFHAPRDGGRVHEGFDVTARCGTPLAAVTTGTIIKRAYDPRLYGNLIILHGLGENRDYWYAHMVHPSAFHKGDVVHVGQIVGYVGKTGNARTVGCHLHFELHVNGHPVNPEPYLRAWDRYS